MSKSFEEFQRKVRNRQFAIDNSWRGHGTEKLQYTQNEGESRRLAELNNNLCQADQVKYFDGYLPLFGNRLKTFIKRAIRKFLKIALGWYLFPIYQRQSHFNGKIVNCVSLQRDMLLELEKEVKHLKESKQKNEALLEEDKNENSVLRENIERDQELLAKVRKQFDEMILEQERTRDNITALEKKVKKNENTLDEGDEFYHCFEERFRGSREEIVGRLQIYPPIIKEHLSDWSNATFVDIGSGRGEWLDVLRENGAADYIGVDLNEKQNTVCESHGHKTICCDGIEYLSQLPDESVDLITGFQVIEHLLISDLAALLKQSYRVLKKGGMILFETPNPRNLCVGADTFYIDMTHKRPLDLGMVDFLVKWYGFSSVKCIEANTHGCGFGLPIVDDNGTHENIVKRINDLCWLTYGPQDYAIFAIKEEQG